MEPEQLVQKNGAEVISMHFLHYSPSEKLLGFNRAQALSHGQQEKGTKYHVHLNYLKCLT